MTKFFRDFFYEEDAMGTVEIVIIIAVLVALAIIFKNQLMTFAQGLMSKFFNADNAGFDDITPAEG